MSAVSWQLPPPTSSGCFSIASRTRPYAPRPAASRANPVASPANGTIHAGAPQPSTAGPTSACPSTAMSSSRTACWRGASTSR